MANDTDDLGAKLAHLKNTHPDQIFGVLRGRIEKQSDVESLACSLVGMGIGVLIDNKWTDDEILAMCLSVLTQTRIAASDPDVLAKMRATISAAHAAQPGD